MPQCSNATIASNAIFTDYFYFTWRSVATSQDAAILSITKKIWLPRVLWQAKVHWAEATFGRTANALLILSAQPPHHYLVVAGPQFEGKRKHRSVKKSGQEQMTNEWPPAKQLVVGANARYYQKNVETSNELRIQTLHGYRGGGIVQHWLHGQ